MRPYSGYYENIYEMAAALMESVVTNHGFVDGNKRTALLITTLMMVKSGYKPRFSEKEMEEFILEIAKGGMPFQQIISQLTKSFG